MSVKIVECPRDAMQGFHHAIPTHLKIEYINSLLKVGFDTLDCGSFVSPKALPVLADTEDVLKGLNSLNSDTKLLAILANLRGAENASQFDIIHYWGYPFSISEQFQLRNTNQNIKQSYSILSEIKKLADDSEKEIVAYLSMGFGNPYNEKWSIEIALEWCKRIADIGINIISLSDTIGLAKPADIEKLFKVCKKELPNIEFGAHLHTREDNYLENISTAYEAGCRRFDSAINGLGGCPFATDKLTGNLPTEKLLKFLEFFNIDNSIDKIQFKHAMKLAQKIFI